MSVTRLITPDDAPALTRLMIDGREFLAPYEPRRTEDFFTVDRQPELIAEALTASSRVRRCRT